MKQALFALCLCISITSYAAPVTWTIHDATFNDGGTMTGQFDYDANTNTYSNISIQTSTFEMPYGDGYEEPITAYLNPSYSDENINNSIFPNQHYLQLVANVGATYDTQFDFSFSTGLTNAGGTISLNSGTELFSGGCSQCSVDQRSLIGGYVAAVPIPAAVWLFGSALAGLGWMRRKQTV
jgi:hypothetical protein